MKKLTLAIAAVAAVALLASCSSKQQEPAQPATTTKVAPAPVKHVKAKHHDYKGEKDVKGETAAK